eukprot:GHVR01117544.1.p2 GENE.GHVR01117544.1~~GHVR01117544.1.p2  ORF type:complete len:146 (+),score=34.47 GHVR01117544.1:32-469(+)
MRPSDTYADINIKADELCLDDLDHLNPEQLRRKLCDAKFVILAHEGSNRALKDECMTVKAQAKKIMENAESKKQELKKVTGDLQLANSQLDLKTKEVVMLKEGRDKLVGENYYLQMQLKTLKQESEQQVEFEYVMVRDVILHPSD